MCFYQVFALDVDGSIKTGFDPFQDMMFIEFDVEIPMPIGKMHIIPYFGEELWVDLLELDNIEKNILSNEYTIGAKLSWDQFWIGYEHRCYHPINAKREPDYNSTINVGASW
jgi:hypothetical protein